MTKPKKKGFKYAGKSYTFGWKYWTDYPFVELGDKLDSAAPVREVTLVDFDGDRYCKVLVPMVRESVSIHHCEAMRLDVKAGYLYDKCQRSTADGFIKVCEVCSKDIPKPHNSCSWECCIEICRRNGGKQYTPNGLRIRSIRADGLMLEHEHGDHPDYIFPVTIEFIGELDDGDREDYKALGGKEPFTDDDVRESKSETHALLYTNGSVAVTIYETCSATWRIYEEKKFRQGKRVVVSVAGACIGGHLWKADEWKLSDESLRKIQEYWHKKSKGYICPAT